MPLRIALIGAGRIGAKRAPAYAAVGGVELAAICDPNESAARSLAERCGVARVCSDPLALIADALIDAVDICTPHDTHAPLAVAAARAGKHILLQKPLACTMDDCRAVAAAADEAGITLMLAMNQRFKPNYDAVRLALQRNGRKNISSAEFEAILSLPSQTPSSHWIFDPDHSGGGVLMSLGVQSIDLARHLLGEIDHVVWSERLANDPRFPAGAESEASAMVRFECGALVDFHFEFSATACTSQTFSIHAGPANYVAGPLTANTNEQVTIHRSADGADSTMACQPSNLPTDDMFVNEVMHFADACRTGHPPATSAGDALKTMAAIFAI